MRLIRSVSAGLIDLVLPPRTWDGAEPAQIEGLSAAMWGRIAFIEAPLCDGCGSPFEHELGDGLRCPACQARPRAWDRARAASVYGEGSRELILQLKHADRTDLARTLSGWIARAAAELVEEADAVVPVPMHWRRLLRRRYNQAAELARPLAARFRRPYRPGLLQRKKADSQAGRSASGRRRAVQGAFVAPERQRRHIEGRRILLIDDVMTTGSTAEACARALKRAGAAAVDVAVVAKVTQSAIAI